MTTEIIEVTKETLVEDNSNFLSVKFDIFNEDEVVQTRRLGFPFDADPEHIKEEVQKVADAYEADLLLAEETKDQEELNTKADETINQLINE